MNLPAIRPISLKKLLIAIGILMAAVFNYNEYFGPDSAPSAPAPSEEVAAPPSDTSPTPVVRSPLERLKDSAEIGNVKDQLTLAVKYSTADGVVKDQAEASRWYLMAARAGDVQAMYEVSMRYRHGFGFIKNTAEADVWRQRAASGGHSDAAYAMARVYGTVTNKGAVIAEHKEHDTGDSSRQLLMWLTRAYELGSVTAKHELAMVRLFGISKRGANKAGYLVPLPGISASAVQLLIENAEAGYWESQFALAELYQVGYADIVPNRSESNKWWDRLDAQSDASVQVAMGRHYFVSDPIQYRAGNNKWKGKSLAYNETNQVALAWFARAAAQQNSDALWQLAVMEYRGTGTPENGARALQLHQKAAELGQIEAMYKLGVAYTRGNGVQKDYIAALHWLDRSIAYEDAYGSNPLRSQAQNAMGLMHEHGYGVANDLVLAYAWYSLASVDGSEEVRKNLNRVAQVLKPEQLLEAEELSRHWKPGNRVSRRI